MKFEMQCLNDDFPLGIISRAAKEQKKALKASKKPPPVQKTKVPQKQKAPKVQQKSAPRVGGKR